MTWLPAIEEMHGEWDPYCDRIFEMFERDVREARFHGRRVSRRRAPEVAGKPDGFWHVTSEGWEKDSSDRIPEMRRCERIPWIGPMIDAAGSDRVRCYRSPRSVKHGHNIVIALPDFSYVVILGMRQGDGGPYMLLITAFLPRGRRKDQFQREYEAAGEYQP